MPFQSSSVDIFETHEAQRVDIRRNSCVNSPTGIYRCDIPTNAVHDDSDISVRDTVYVGLYTATRGMKINSIIKWSSLANFVQEMSQYLEV